MTDQQMIQFKEEIATLVEAKIEEKQGGKGWRMIQFLTSILLGCVTAVIIPFGVWTVQQIHKLDIADKEIQNRQSVQQAWIDQGPRFTSRDAENLKLQLQADTNEKLSREISKVNEKLDKINESANQTSISIMQTRIELQDLKTLVTATKKQNP